MLAISSLCDCTIPDSLHFVEFAGLPLRIKSGEATFDPAFFVELDEETAPMVDGSRFKYADVADTGIVWARDPGDFESIDEFYTESRWEPFAVDVDTWDATPMDIDGLEATGFPGEVMIVGGELYFTVNRSDGEPGGALASLRDGVLTEEVLYSEWLQAVAKVR